jgi:hypothetical protein
MTAIPAPLFEVREYLTASAIRAAKVPIHDVRLDEDGRCTFVFDDTGGQATQAAHRHQRGELELSSLTMVTMVQLCKNEIFGLKRGGFQ